MENMVARSPDLHFWQSKKVLVTGHSGFKGAWLVQVLKSLSCEIVGYGLPLMSSPSVYEQSNTFSAVSNTKYGLPEFIDINEISAIHAAFHKFQPDIVFHLAAQPLVLEGYRNPVQTFQTNVMGTVNVLDAIRATASAQAVVIVTTDKVYQNEGGTLPYKENDRLGGVDPYSASKTCAEFITACYRESFFQTLGIPIATARAGNVIGGGDWSLDRLIPDIIRACNKCEDVTLRNPHAIRPWQHVLEATWGYLRLAECLCHGGEAFSQGYNFGPFETHNMTVDEVTKLVLRLMGSNSQVKYDEVAQFNEAQVLSLDASRAKNELAWVPKLSARQAINLTCEWYREQQKGLSSKTLFENQIKEYFEINL